MKKGILLFLTTLLCLGLTACTEQKTTPPVSGQSSQQEEPDTQSSAEVTDAASTSKDSHQEEPDTQSSTEVEKSQSTNLQELQSDSEDTEAPESQERKLKMLVDEQELDVTLYDTPAANALYDMLPLTLTFEDFGHTEKIAYLMSTCTNGQILTELQDYVARVPEFSLDDEKEYDNVQELTLSSEEDGTIYYTVDGSKATTEGTEYKEPIQINKEGKTTVRAIFVNKKGIESVEVQKTYMIRFPVAEAPAVSPTTGQYKEPISVEVQVPEGYTAYYTTDGSEPSDQSVKYIGAFPLYQDTELNVVLIDGNGKKSEITTRKYQIRS